MLEKLELLAAIEHNCGCHVNVAGLRLTSCSPHQMLALDQRALDGLLWSRRVLHRLRIEEGITWQV